ncbi:acyltransferase family protein [Duganella hordei]|uniref:acyltransferase family protein n=1 Tax=Duganella hordei TaxID=2865934 RepID=UPI0033429099
MSTSKARLQFLDALRGIAVFLVIFSHIMHERSQLAQLIDANYFQIGQAGVSLFFLISGYIIPKSLNASPSLQVFWLHRFFRLYPAYWVCLIAVLLFASAGLYHFQETITPFGMAVNFTMMQGFVGIKNVINVFWSLKFEMAFYFLMTVISVTGMLKRPFLIFVGYSLLTAGLALGMKFGMHKFFAYGVFNLELMLLGWVLAEWHMKRLAGKYAAVSVALGLLTTMIAAYAAFAGRTEELAVGTLSLVPMASAWGASIVFFVATLLTTEYVRWPRWLAWMGTVSYSAYLLHPIVIGVSQNLIPVGPLLMCTQFGLSFVLAWLGYRYIETPSIAYGKKVGNRFIPAARQAARV